VTAYRHDPWRPTPEGAVTTYPPRLRIASGTPFGFPVMAGLDNIKFGGIQGEARFVGAAGIQSAGAIDTSNGLASVVLPDAATTDALVTIEIEEYWLNTSLNIGLEWRNLAAGAGNVRFHFELREVDILMQTVAAAPTPLNYDLTEPAGGAGMVTTTVIASEGLGNPTRSFTPDIIGPPSAFFGSVYALLIRRVGADAADTLAGGVGLVAVSWGRHDPDLSV
jgi:hypothetical protein